ncbi:hypothetical protein GIB67_042916 [Kingdonia uniflora]|uniref:Uncharacterized protein n=1 Tax=Kingdonia uniflora TaxID=39325 RepID=A0A7J7P3K8_9MAGN|nr:hypothetical protein GIB67_042916 [Kingdonia uniflora]
MFSPSSILLKIGTQSWYKIERWYRRKIFIGNYYAVSPNIVITRFPDVKSVTLKGKQHFADFNLVLEGNKTGFTTCYNTVSVISKLPKYVSFSLVLETSGLEGELLYTGAFSRKISALNCAQLVSAFANCKRIKNLSGFWEVVPTFLPSVYSICTGITALKLRPDLIKLQCPNLHRLWVLDYIENSGLDAVAASCKDLEELRVFPSDPYDMEQNVLLTEQGLVSVAEGCPKLNSVLYFCGQMSNKALITVAKNCPNLTGFRLCIIEPRIPDYLTQQPFDLGFGAIVQQCKDLQRLSLSGDSDLGLHHVLSGCTNLRKLEIRNCPFGDKALLANAAKLQTMRSLWMSSCSLSFGACKLLGWKMPGLNVEVIDERGLTIEFSFLNWVHKLICACFAIEEAESYDSVHIPVSLPTHEEIYPALQEVEVEEARKAKIEWKLEFGRLENEFWPKQDSAYFNSLCNRPDYDSSDEWQMGQYS